MKKLLSLLLVFVMMFSLLPMSALAEEEDVQTETEQSLETEGSVGILLSNTLDGVVETTEDVSVCRITDIVMDDTMAVVEFRTDRDSELVVAVYEEESMKMLGSGHAVVSPDADTAEIEITIDAMPDHFIVSAYLLDADTLDPLGEAYTSSYYTEAVSDLRQKTAEDFDENLVLLLEDGNTETNFLVFGEGTLLAEAGDSSNQITDNGDGTYTIVNADESFLALTEGDSFAYTCADGTLLIVVAKSVVVNGSTVTVTADTDAELSDVFDYVKIEATSDGADAIVDTSTMSEGVTYLGTGDGASTEKSRAIDSSFEGERKESQKFTIVSHEDEDAGIEIKVDVTFEFSVKAKLEVYVARKYKHVDCSITLENSISGEIVGKITAYERDLGRFKIPLVSEVVFLSFKPKLVLTFEASLTFEMSQSSTLGFVYDSNYGFQSKSKDPAPDQDPDKSLEFEGKVYFGVKVEFDIVLVDEDILAFGISGEVGCELSMKQDVLDDSDSEKHDCEVCFGGDISIVGEISVKLEALFGTVGLSKTLISTKFKITDVYYSDTFHEFGFSVCPHKSYLVTVECSVIDMNSGEYLDDVSGWQVVVTDSDSTEPVEQLILETNKDGEASFYARNGTYSIIVSPPAGLHTSVEGTVVTVHNTETKASFFLLIPRESGAGDDKSDENTTEPTESDGEVLYSGTCGVGVQWELYESGLLYIYGNGMMENYTSASSVPWYSYRATITRVIVAKGVSSIGRASFYGCTSLTGAALPDGVMNIGQDAFYGCTALADITIPDGVMDIGNDAFYNCSSLERIAIADGVMDIGSEAFYGCTALVDIAIPDSVTSIGRGAFRKCTSLSSITLPNALRSLESYAFYGCTSLADVSLPYSLISIEDYVFYGCTALASIAIPDGLMSIGAYAFYNCSAMEDITLPDSLSSIGSYTFYGCKLLSGITIPEGVTGIGRAMFYGCTSLTAAVLPDGVTSIGQDAFYGCTSLAGIVLPDSVTSIGSGAFHNCSALEHFVIPAGVTTIGSEVFYGCTSLADITIPDSVTSIGSGAFRKCTSLSSVALPNALTSLGSYAFYGCTALADIAVPDSLTTIGTYSFYNCSAMEDIDLPDGLTSIGSYAFYGCKLLSSIKIPDGVTSIGRATFYGCTSLATATFPDGLTSIGRDAFYGCTSLAGIALPDGVTNIGQGAFRNCTSFVSVALPDSVTSIGSEAFYKCTALASITIRMGVESIGGEAFYGCASLTSITIPDSVISIGGGAFRNCVSLSNIILPNSLTSIGGYTFYGCTSLANLTIPDSVTSIGDYAFYNCTSFTSIILPDGVTSIKSYVFYGCTSLMDIAIPDDVTNIGEYAFSGCKSLANITIPDSVISIGGNAFSACASLTSIVLPDGVTRIEWGTFRSCTSLVDITIPDGVTLIGGTAFSGCTSLVDITIPGSVTFIGDSMFDGCSALTSISIPDGITGITHSAFKRCTSLTSITIPASVTSVDDYAFWQCFDLADVYYGGSEEQWEAVTIETHNGPLTSANIHYNYSTTATAAMTLPVEGTVLDEAPIGEETESTIEEITEEETEETVEEVTEESTEAGTEEETEEVSEATTEETTTAKTVTEEKTTYEADEIELLAAYTGTTDGSTASFDGLVPNERYVLLVVKDAAADDILAAENLLYIVQGVSGETGALNFRYTPREDATDAAAVVYGASGTPVSEAKITIGMTVGGDVVVTATANGITLVENEDYTYTSTEVDGVISVTVIGSGEYIGTVTVTLDHVPGDMDGKDGVTILDVLALLKYVAGISDNIVYGDVDNNGAINILDVLQLLKYVAGIAGTTIY